jgi:hypothetical protein
MKSKPHLLLLLLAAAAGVLGASPARAEQLGAALFTLPPEPIGAPAAPVSPSSGGGTSSSFSLSGLLRFAAEVAAPGPSIEVKVLPMAVSGGWGLRLLAPLCIADCLDGPGPRVADRPLLQIIAPGTGETRTKVEGPPGEAAIAAEARKAQSKVPQAEENARP